MLQQIKNPILKEFEEFEQLFSQSFTSPQDQLLRQVMQYTETQKGKQVRPIFALLCGKLCGEINRDTLNIAASYETLHTASLIHDDVVDNTMKRRNAPSVNALFDNRISVLSGDYLLSKAMRFISETRNPELFSILCTLGQTLAEGELLQLQHAYSIPTEDEYIDIIRRKTAVLFTLTAKSAAITAHATEKQMKDITEFADMMGICFQIKDDIFDYTPNAQIGKPTLNDIREGKVTLPLLHTLQQLPYEAAQDIMDKAKKGEFTEEYFYNIGTLVAKHHGIEYAECKIDYYISKAHQSLKEFEDTPIRDAMMKLLSFTITRNK
ncbi:MAG: polyprenyl synthetase family protein [Paludibacteraceae bacterium]|nr:polyprenyl synthetase family protein [Paludibacteraceae bacterium]